MPKSDLPFNPAEYALVADRIELFFQRNPAGRILTALMSRSGEEITFKATIYRSGDPSEPLAATGWASERPNG